MKPVPCFALALVLCGSCTAQQGAPAREARQKANADQIAASNAAAFARNPEEAKLSPEFVARARVALNAINSVIATADGVAGYDYADRMTKAVVGDKYTLGEQIVWFALGNYLLSRMQDEFEAEPAGVLPAPTAKTEAQQKACTAAIKALLDSGAAKPAVPECELMEFGQARARH